MLRRPLHTFDAFVQMYVEEGMIWHYVIRRFERNNDRWLHCKTSII